VTTIDWIIVAGTVVFATMGFRQGFLLGALSLAGFAGGAVAGARIAPHLLHEGSESPYAPVLALAGAVLGGGLLAGGLEALGARLRSGLRLPGLATLDGLLGAVLAATIALGLAWIGGAVALQTPGAAGLRQDIQRSLVLQRLNRLLPPSGPILNALARFDPVPRLNGPAPGVAPPRAAIAHEPGVRAAAGSVVRVLGTACGLGVEGSGWVAGKGLVVTNAHVVAGQEDTTVQAGGRGPGLHARALAFDPRDDVAVLSVDGLDAPPLAIAEHPQRGTEGAILGFPHDGPYDVRAARIGSTMTVVSSDAYGHGPVQRPITALRGNVRSGNSGGPVVDARGRVVTTVFAATVRGPHGGYGVPNAVVRHALAGAARPVGTGPCAR
jgi:hypothetical protein